MDSGNRLEISPALMDKLQAAARREYQAGVAALGLSASAEQIDALLEKVRRDYQVRSNAAAIAANASAASDEVMALLDRVRQLMEAA